MSSSIIPSDIWGEILVRLPAECLIRARAVSKEWRAVIDDPCFVRAHTNKNHQLSSSKIIFQNEKAGPCYSLDFEALNSLSNGSQEAIVAAAATPLDLNFVNHSPYRSLDLYVSECNGLFLTTEKSKSSASLTIWNPLTHERLDLPPPPLHFSENEFWSETYGLGYDSSANDDYKAVVILRDTHETGVYSLKSDSWRRSILDCPCDGWGPYGPGVFVCGALNWLSIEEMGVYDCIVSLDVQGDDEKYTLLQMPPCLKTRWNGNLIVLGGRLAMCDVRFGRHLDVWVMKVYGDDNSWFKLFSIDRSQQINNEWEGFLRPVAFFIKDKLSVFLQDTNAWFFMYDVDNNSLKRLKMDDSIIGKQHSLVCAIQMFVGTIFRLHANCAARGGVR